MAKSSSGKKKSKKKSHKKSASKTGTTRSGSRKRGRAVKAKKTRKKAGKRGSGGGRKPAGRSLAFRFLKWTMVLALLVFAGVVAYGVYLDQQIKDVFAGQPWARPAQVFASPVDLYAGRRLSAADLAGHLQALGYQQVGTPQAPGQFTYRNTRIRLISRDVQIADMKFSPIAVELQFSDGRISKMLDGRNKPLPIVQLSPLLIGSVLPKSGEDRMVVGASGVPSLLPETLKLVEDRSFESHFGVDPKGILRAAWVNLRSGEISQGGSTISQQLIKSHFLSNERTLRRKFNEALMAIALDARMEKDAIMLAYINEIYLGQHGKRAIHGFDLAAHFYFGRALKDLETHQIATLVGMVKGPSLYNPRRHPERTRKRRDQVLRMMEAHGLLSAEAAASARSRSLEVLDADSKSHYAYPDFLSVVKSSLLRDYPAQELSSEGLTVFTTLDVLAQSGVEKSLNEILPKLEKAVAIKEGELQAAVVVMSPETGELVSLAGGRTRGYQGLNRAVHIARPIGSLMKPFIAAAALENERYELTDLVSNEPVQITLDNGKVWEPGNFSEQYFGDVPLYRAVADSINVPMVRVGMDIGVSKVESLVKRLGFESEQPWYPSALLGAVAMAPVDVAQLYAGLANRGFVTPKRTVRRVVNGQAETLSSYPLQVDQRVNSNAVFKTVEAMKLVMLQGTGRSAMTVLPRDLQVAGKSGSTNDLRDSWFAGFSADLVVVVWIGLDDNKPTSLTGARGALRVWRDIMAQMAGVGLHSEIPDGLVLAPADYASGVLVPVCQEGILIPVSERNYQGVRCEVW